MATGTFTYGQIVGSKIESISSNPGLVCVTEQSFSASGSVSVYDCFTREYQSYHILIRCLASVANNYVSMSFLANNTVIGSNTYQNAGQYLNYSSGGIGNWSGTAQPGCFVAYNNSTTLYTAGSVVVHNPFDTTHYTQTEQMFDAGNAYLMWGASRLPTTTLANGFRLTHNGGGNLTGNVWVYGYRRGIKEF